MYYIYNIPWHATCCNYFPTMLTTEIAKVMCVVFQSLQKSWLLLSKLMKHFSSSQVVTMQTHYKLMCRGTHRPKRRDLWNGLAIPAKPNRHNSFVPKVSYCHYIEFVNLLLAFSPFWKASKSQGLQKLGPAQWRNPMLSFSTYFRDFL